MIVLGIILDFLIFSAHSDDILIIIMIENNNLITLF